MTTLCFIAMWFLGWLTNRYIHHKTKWWIILFTGATAVAMGVLTLFLAIRTPPLLITVIMFLAVLFIVGWLVEGLVKGCRADL